MRAVLSSTYAYAQCVRHLFVTSVACGATHLALLVNRDLTAAVKDLHRYVT
jgi:hypothetical protein